MAQCRGPESSEWLRRTQCRQVRCRHVPAASPVRRRLRIGLRSRSRLRPGSPLDLRSLSEPMRPAGSSAAPLTTALRSSSQLDRAQAARTRACAKDLVHAGHRYDLQRRSSPRPGISTRSLAFSSGISTFFRPPRNAARSFSFSPPIGSTLPRNVIFARHGDVATDRDAGDDTEVITGGHRDHRRRDRPSASPLPAHGRGCRVDRTTGVRRQNRPHRDRT